MAAEKDRNGMCICGNVRMGHKNAGRGKCMVLGCKCKKYVPASHAIETFHKFITSAVKAKAK